MSYSVTYDGEHQLVLIVIQGTIDITEIRSLTTEVARLAKEHACFRVLNDFRAATLSASTMEIYNLPKLVSKQISAAGLQIYPFKRALVFAQASADLSFFEAVSVNQAQNVRLFRDIEEAMQWLSGD
jgi:hypothetical protein